METTKEKNQMLTLWNRVPILIRAIILGLLISTLGIVVWGFVAVFIPMPWAIVVMIGVLLIYLQFFSGSLWGKKTQAFRKANFRKIKLSKKLWGMSILTALLIVLIEQSGLIVTFRIMEFPAEKFIAEYSFLAQVPKWAAWLFIVMISAVAGICEETGYRGYLQVPLEKRYGPFLAILISSFVFVIIHLHQAWSGAIIIHIFAVGLLFGTIAYYSGSLVPGIIGHVIMDLFNFSFWWSDLGSQFSRNTISVTGVDLHFIGWLVVLVVAITAFVAMIFKLKQLRENVN